jgi:hypothetical protein
MIVVGLALTNRTRISTYSPPNQPSIPIENRYLFRYKIGR